MSLILRDRVDAFADRCGMTREEWYRWFSGQGLKARREDAKAYRERIRHVLQDLVDQGLGIRGIARELTKLGYPTPAGKRTWNRGSAYWLLNQIGLRTRCSQPDQFKK